jgi:hypothetical protein
MAASPTPPLTPDESSSVVFELIVVILCVGIAAACVFIVLFCCRRRCEGNADAKGPELPAAPEPPAPNPAVADLIPPLFYTEGLRDPLMQEDLRDRLHGPVIVNPGDQTLSQ